MNPKPIPTRTCPACHSGQYAFRHRKRVSPPPGEAGTEVTETKYRCKACGHEWTVRLSAAT